MILNLRCFSLYLFSGISFNSKLYSVTSFYSHLLNSKMNPLASLIGNYGDSDDDSDSESGAQRAVVSRSRPTVHALQTPDFTPQSASIHPAPIAHCPWSACYDESSGFTYYWNQQTNAVTWEAPPEYLLALKLAQQQLHSQGSTEVSVEEWQLYQQALAEKQQSKVISKGALIKPVKNNEKAVNAKNKNIKKRKLNDVEDEKIELITSYYNSDSESNEEPDTPVIPSPSPSQPPPPKAPKTTNKKIKLKPTTVQYGPTLPPNQNYSVPIGPELPQEKNIDKPKSPQNKKVSARTKEELIKTKSSDNEDNNDDSILLTKLKDKAKLLEKLGGELPSGLQKIIEEETRALNSSPKLKEIQSTEYNIDDLLNEIEKKELPKVKKIDMFDEADGKSNDSPKASPKSRDMTPPIEHKPLFPSIKNISIQQTQSTFTNVNNEVNGTENCEKVDNLASAIEKKGANLYLMDNNEPIENISRKKLRLSNSVLPERKKKETPCYTTKYSEHIEGFSNERTGLGFTKDEDIEGSGKNTISYGNGLTFTKGETLNEEKKDDDLDNLTDLVEAKLKYLNQLQPCSITPVHEMLIQMQTLVSAFRCGALGSAYWRRWAEAAAYSLQQHEASAAPPGWTCVFQRSEGRYRYRRETDGFIQWEYPAVASTDMDISTTPPHPGFEEREDIPPLPSSPPVPPPPPPPVLSHSAPRGHGSGAGGRVHTPPPPAWADPPPPGCDDLPPLPIKQNHEIGAELMSFYNDIAELEKQTSDPPTAPSSPSPPHHCELIDKEKSRDNDKVNKKKSKVKISTSVGLKHRSVSTLVAKWQQVADEISSD